MNPPLIESWVQSHVSSFENLTWSEECQGLTTDGQYWYVCSNNEDYRAIYKFSLNFNQSLGSVELPTGSGNHVGDIDYYDGKIYIAVADPKSRVWVIDGNLNTLEVTDLDPAVSFFMGWCAINPWNGYLYSSAGDGVHRIHVYDPAKQFAYKGVLPLGGTPVNGLQGGCFSSNGKLYLTSDKYVNEEATKDIRAYSALNGAFLGAHDVAYDEEWPESEEWKGWRLRTWYMAAEIRRTCTL